MNKKQAAHCNYVDKIHGLAPLYKAAEPFYKAPKRLYHTLGHATDVESAVFLLSNIPSVAIVLAARWHDAIYVPGAPNGLNELLSAEALRHASSSLYLNATARQLVSLACELIKDTDVKTHLCKTRRKNESGVLLDADLSSLATNYSKFRLNQLYLIQEQTGRKYTLDGCEKSAEFLTKLATCRSYIYHTDAGRAFFEADAKANIERWCLEVKQMRSG